jgi:uncharacterized membrane protein/predicted DsbA family dithiol-disulfide isomerase
VTRFLLRTINLIGLAVSSLMLIDYLRPLPIFCDGAAGCGLVRQSRWASFFGIPTPAFGVAFFVVALVLSMWPARRLLVYWAAAGALGAVSFISLQIFAIKAICPYCMAADGSAILLYLLALAARDDRAPLGTSVRGTLAALGVLAAAAPFAVERVVAKPAAAAAERAVAAPAYPTVVAREAKPGWITVVEFVDFECPYCRRLHKELKDALAGFSGAVRVVRKHNPLVTLHKNAMDAARAACCGDEQGKGDEMAEALYSAPPDDIDADGCEKIAEKLGLDMAKYNECISSKRPDERIAADLRDADAAGIAGVAPVFWVGSQKFEGVRPASIIRQALVATQ